MRFTLKSAGGIVFCVGAAIVLSFVMNDDSEGRLAAPFICLFAVLMTAFLCGRLAAILGATGANLTFCLLLFPPLGSIRVSNPNQRVAVIAFQILALGAAFLAPPSLVVQGDVTRTWKGKSRPRED